MKKILIIFSALISMTCKNDYKSFVNQSIVDPIDFNDNKQSKVRLSEVEDWKRESTYHRSLITKAVTDSCNYNSILTIRH